MKKTSLLLVCMVISFQCFSQRKISFDEGWRFHRGDVENGSQINYNDADWRNIDLPHDWSIEDLPGTQSPFSPDAINGVSVGFTTGGIGWYRKTFTLPLVGRKHKTTGADERIIILFDGVYMNADVWINGVHLGNHPYGYTSFYYDITDKINKSGKNVIAVQVKNVGANSRWYAGSGINRHTWLIETSPVHVTQWGTFLTTSEVSAASAKINAGIVIKNERKAAANITVVTRIVNSKGIEVAKTSGKQTIATNDTYNFNNNATVKSPDLWSTGNPHLYKAITEVYVDGKQADQQTTKFGIRKISFDAANGFMLNDKPMKLRGGCFHIDNGPLGAKSLDRAEIRRVALLKASGFNAIRCSHNPPAPAFLEACDSLGMLVIDEAFDCWTEGKNPDDYHVYFKDWWQRDLQSMVLRDRNHPSIIMWSIGNEIPGMDRPSIADTARLLADYVRSLDNTRPVTAAANSVSDKKGTFFAALDVCGYNYAKDKYVSDHARKPDRVMVATESYALEQFDYWMNVLDHPWVIGDFVWTGYDYIGESSIGWYGYPQEKNLFYPWNLAWCGDIDICGWKRPQSFYRDALWKKDQLSVFVKPLHPSFPVNKNKSEWSKWNWDDVISNWNFDANTDSLKQNPDALFEINVYSSCDEVELFLNGKSLGKKNTNRSTKFMAVYHTPFRKGELKAIGYDHGKKVNTYILKTAEKPSLIRLSADRKVISADNQDLSYVTVELVDKKGNLNPNAENLVHFEIEGTGTIAGVGNANPVSVESYQLPQRKAWQGKCLVIIKSKKQAGEIILKASSPGLQPAQLVLQAK